MKKIHYKKMLRVRTLNGKFSYHRDKWQPRGKAIPVNTPPLIEQKNHTWLSQIIPAYKGLLIYYDPLIIG